MVYLKLLMDGNHEFIPIKLHVIKQQHMGAKKYYSTSLSTKKLHFSFSSHR